MPTPEQLARNKIDKRLCSPLLGWEVIPWTKNLETSLLLAHAVEEYPTETGPADYALFVNGKLLGVIEAKKEKIGVEGVLAQAKRYSIGVPNTIGEWREYKAPFLYSSNGELIYYLDVRKKENRSYQLSNFHSPQALLDKFNRDTAKAEQWFHSTPVNTITRLYPFQEKAIQKMEQALIDLKEVG